MSVLALDTSVAIPLLARGHAEHNAVRSALAGHALCFTGHSQIETYSVLTRLPGDARLESHDAARLVSTGFGATLHLRAKARNALPSLLAAHGIVGGATYDALVGLSTVGTEAVLVTRDRRAASTYTAINIEFRFV